MFGAEGILPDLALIVKPNVCHEPLFATMLAGIFPGRLQSAYSNRLFPHDSGRQRRLFKWRKALYFADEIFLAF